MMRKIYLIALIVTGLGAARGQSLEYVKEYNTKGTEPKAVINAIDRYLAKHTDWYPSQVHYVDESSIVIYRKFNATGVAGDYPVREPYRCRIEIEATDEGCLLKSYRYESNGGGLSREAADEIVTNMKTSKKKKEFLFERNKVIYYSLDNNFNLLASNITLALFDYTEPNRPTK